MNSKKSFEETGQARILVIGISSFGEKLINRLQKYQNGVNEDFGCTFLAITNEHDIESLPKTLFEESDLILIVAKEDQFSIKEITKILKALNGENQLVIGFLNGFLQYNFGAKLTNRVNLAENSEDAFQALRFLPDFMSFSLEISKSLADLRTIFERAKYFNVATQEVSENMNWSDIDLYQSESIFFGVYGDGELDQATFDSAALQICNHADSESTLLYGINYGEPSGTKPRVVILY